MSWIQKLYDTYPHALALKDKGTPLVPPAHTLQTAHINVTLDEKGNFEDAKVLPPKTLILLPVTESSENRTSGEAPHPLADKIQYLAVDYQQYGGEKKSYFDSYYALLNDWVNSPYSHPKIEAIQRYISQKTLLQDLIKSKVLFTDEHGKIKTKWDEDSDAPAIFSVLPKTKGQIEFGSALICWTVEIPNDLTPNTWEDTDVQNAWGWYISNKDGTNDFCMVSGETAPIAALHPAKLRHTGDKAKLISSNDNSGYTFRGRFNEASQAASVSADVTAKAHSTLRFLISRQGSRNGEQVTIVWAVNMQPVPSPIEDLSALFFDDDLTGDDSSTAPADTENRPDWSVNLGAQAAENIKKRLKGYQAQLPLHESISLMVLDSATPGRMAVAFYQEILSQDYFSGLEKWLDDFSWYQRHIYEKTVIWPVLPPAPKNILQTIYGADPNDKLKAQLYNRILPSIIGGTAVPIPRDIVENAFKRACNPNAFERWEWERNVGVACALIKGHYARHPDYTQRRTYNMALDVENTNRDYLYGRLLVEVQT